MSITRTKSPDWVFGEILTNTQMNALDTNVTNAVDKRVGAQEVDSHSVWRDQPIVPITQDAGGVGEIPGDWFFSESTLMWQMTAATTANANMLVALTNIPDKCSVTAVKFWTKGTGFSTLPSSMPQFELNYLDSAGTATFPTPVDVVDGANLSTFNTFHAVTVTLDTPILVDQTSSAKTFFGRIEYSGGGSAGGTSYRVGRIEVQCTITRLTPG